MATVSVESYYLEYEQLKKCLLAFWVLTFGFVVVEHSVIYCWEWQEMLWNLVSVSA